MNNRLRNDLWLQSYFGKLDERAERVKRRAKDLQGKAASLSEFASGHEFFGLHKKGRNRVFREWAPNAESITLYGSFCDWRIDQGIPLERRDHGIWEASFPMKSLSHGDLYRLHIAWPGGSGERLPAWSRRVIQDENSKIFNAQVWDSTGY